MKCVGGRKLERGQTEPSTARLATSVPSFKFTFHTDASPPKTHQRYVPNAENAGHAPSPLAFDLFNGLPPDEPFLPFLTRLKTVGVSAAYETTEPSKEKAEHIRQNVAHMNELKAEEGVFIDILLSLHYSFPATRPCACGIPSRVRKVACTDCHQAPLLCPQCWLKQTPDDAHALGIRNASIGLGHYGEKCPEADLARSFTLVDSNGIHATALAFCRCKTADGKRGEPEYRQLLEAGIFPGSVKDPKTGYTLGLLHGWPTLFLLLQFRTYMATSSPSRGFYEHLQIMIERGEAHGLDTPIPGEVNRPYPNRPEGFLGVNCAACPERGVNMPLVVDVASYLRHLISQNLTLDGNWKANLFFKRDDGSDTALTDGKLYFPNQKAFEEFAKTYVVPDDDKEVPSVSGVVACACDHAVLGSLVDMLKGEAFALGTYAQREQLRHTNSPPHDPETASPVNFSYDSWCSFVVNQVKRALALFPEEEWLHTLLACVEGQIPATTLTGTEATTAEMIWAFLNPLGSSTRQMTGAARHDIINFVMQAWNTLKRNCWLLSDSMRFDCSSSTWPSWRTSAGSMPPKSLLVTTLEEDYEVSAWQTPKRVSARGDDSADNGERAGHHDYHRARETKTERGHEAGTPIAQWIHDGMSIERSQGLTVALLRNHREHPLEETWASITKLRDTLNLDLKKFRERQWEISPRLKLSALDVDEPELTAIKCHRLAAKEAEIKLRCTEADSSILAVRAASLALSAVRKAREQDYRGQAGITRSQRNLQKAELMKTFEITIVVFAERVTISQAAVVSAPSREEEGGEDEPQLLAGTQTLKRSGGFQHNRCSQKCLKDIAPDDVDGRRKGGKESVKKGKSKKKRDGWIWLESLMRGQGQSDEKLAAYKKESDRVQWFRAEAEMYRWLEQYERKHAELFRVIGRYHRDSVVWAGQADREEERNGGVNGKATYARMQAAMHRRLEHNAKVIFKSAESGAHHDWVSASNFDELVSKIDGWRDVVFQWMDDMGIHRAYKDF
ncbi:hypothetical protein B0H13DRAFT_2339007 [Mycena leptocephala]|nr:hypothetical protein B0H13DRAFT_2339007 [Mycena leptocephala]